MLRELPAARRPRAPRTRLARLAALLLLLLGLFGCGGAPSPPSVPLTETEGAATSFVGERSAAPTVALVMKTLTNPFFVEMEQGARRAEAELGIRLIVKAASQETSIDQQIAIIESLILDRVDAIVVAPGDSTSLVPVLARAQRAGITVVNIDNRLDPTLVREMGLVRVPFVSVDNEDGAYQAARVLSAAAAGPSEAIIIEGITSAQNAMARARGAERAFAENPAIRVVARETAHWKIDEAFAVTERLMTAHPDVRLIFCANDMMALGALQYLDKIGREDVLVAGFDALAEARREVEAGRLAATVDQQAAEQGYLGVRYAAAMLEGHEVPAETMVSVKVVTRAQAP